MKVVKKFTFDAAHHLPNYKGKCKQLHGHTYHLEVIVEGKVDPHTGMVVDFSELKHVVTSTALDYLDHKLLNDVIENPTAENTIVWIHDKISKHIDGIVTLRLWETPDSYVEL